MRRSHLRYFSRRGSRTSRHRRKRRFSISKRIGSRCTTLRSSITSFAMPQPQGRCPRLSAWRTQDLPRYWRTSSTLRDKPASISRAAIDRGLPLSSIRCGTAFEAWQTSASPKVHRPMKAPSRSNPFRRRWTARRPAPCRRPSSEETFTVPHSFRSARSHVESGRRGTYLPAHRRVDTVRLATLGEPVGHARVAVASAAPEAGVLSIQQHLDAALEPVRQRTRNVRKNSSAIVFSSMRWKPTSAKHGSCRS